MIYFFLSYRTDLRLTLHFCYFYFITIQIWEEKKGVELQLWLENAL